ncbi:hypothetical protein GCM10023115_55880 [Pontixanthobacter gangjinensis]|uniref:Uncharacterized protein n=1 Tax=Pontixanthobacter gangjinensis TaxID=1028742 RepID=A0A6I4SPN6_9SPHN|nr:hypothetical protein [Pontixanthobacter gangjinensis]MXO57871.1 hypothetical protein [Pontixanthobacter gangjinensis]
MALTKSGESFYRKMAWVLMAIVIAGFGSAQLTSTNFAPDFTPLLAVHAFVFITWYALLIIQPSLIAAGKWDLHKRIGLFSIGLTLLMVVLGYLLVRTSIARPDFSIAGKDALGSAIFPFTDIVNFVIIYALALYYRADGQTHKRLMILSGVMMIDPAAARLVLSLGGSPPLIAGLELALFAAFFIHDFRTRGRPHWATVIAIILFGASMAAKFTIADGEAWSGFVRTFFG